MTEQQIDRERLAEWRDQTARIVEKYGNEAWAEIHANEVVAIIDALTQAEAELDSWMARAYEAEKRAWQAETRLAGWMEHWNATARTGAVDEVAAILEANARAERAEARVKAVRALATEEDECGDWVVTRDAVLRALESGPPPVR